MSHLLNFSLPQRELLDENSYNKINTYSRKKKEENLSRTREDYLQANFQFIVDCPPNVFISSAHTPDSLIEWDYVEQVWVPHVSTYECPICLQEVYLPKITSCGHIFCWTCLLRYFSYGKKRCPICFDPLSKRKFKSVRWKEVPILSNRKSSIELALMKRSKGYCYPTHYEHVQLGHELIPFINEDFACFSHLIQTTQEYLNHFINNEIQQLHQYKKLVISSKEEEVVEYIDEGIQYCQKRLDQFQHCSHAEPEMKLQPKHEKEEFFHYYQQKDGSKIFLSSFTLKYLMQEYQAINSLPRVLHGIVSNIDTIIITSEHRKRLRFLNHLPLHTSVIFVEMDISSYLSAEVNEIYQNEKNERDKTRKKQEKNKLKKMKRFEKEKKKENSSIALYNQNDFYYPLSQNKQATDSIEKSIELNMNDLAMEESQENLIGEFSFAKVTVDNGFYPTLDETTKKETEEKKKPSYQEKNVWGVNKTSSQSTQTVSCKLPSGKKQFKQFLSNTPQRSYK